MKTNNIQHQSKIKKNLHATYVKQKTKKIELIVNLSIKSNLKSIFELEKQLDLMRKKKTKDNLEFEKKNVLWNKYD